MIRRDSREFAEIVHKAGQEYAKWHSERTQQGPNVNTPKKITKDGAIRKNVHDDEKIQIAHKIASKYGINQKYFVNLLLR
jgi:hypothetical protein